MKLLMMSACLPRPSWGASTRNYHLLKALTTRHQVTLVALVNSDESVTTSEVAHLASITPALRVLSRPLSRAKRWQQLRSLVSAKSYFLNLFLLPEVQETLNALFAKEQYDAILYESALIAGYQAPQNVKIIIDQHNIEYELLERTYELEKGTLRKWYSKQENRLLKKGELDRCRHANLVVVTSERERILLQHSLPTTTIAVVSNGVDVEMFRSDGYTQEKSHQIIFTGTMDYYPNNEAVLFFAQCCWPLIRAQVPDATWLIVGKKPSAEVQRLAELPGVTVTGQVPDVRPYLASSAVAIAPLRIGSGTRLKILEALAMQKAVVSTSIGCEGLALVPGKHLLVEDQPEMLARAVVTLLQDVEKRQALGEAGRSLVEAEYSWEWCGNQLLAALEQIV
jgi:sugar transferase (PEP-CTERM/EpsH1 system associated)